MQPGLHCKQEPAEGSTLMEEQVWDTELFPKDPRDRSLLAWLAGGDTGTTDCLLNHIKDLTLCSSLWLT